MTPHCKFSWDMRLVEHAHLRLSTNGHIHVESEEQLERLGFRQLSVYIRRSQYAPALPLVTNEEALLLEQVINYLAGTKERHRWVSYAAFGGTEAVDLQRPGRAWALLCAVASVFVASSVAILYNYMAVYLVPVIYLLLNRMGLLSLDPLPVYISLPWIGLYEYPFALRNSASGFLQSLVKLFLLMLLLYVALVSVLREWLFFSWTSFDDAEDLVNLITFLEIESTLFFRTRSTLKYLPRTLFVLLVGYGYYCQRGTYTFRISPLALVYHVSQSLVLLFIIYFEKPAASEWNQRSPHTPTESRPRCMYNPFFSTAWLNDMAPFWTVFVPQCGQSAFSEGQWDFITPEHPRAEDEPPL